MTEGKSSPFYLGGLATMCACLFTNPFEVIKVRMQLDGELRSSGSYKKRYSNIGQGFVTILREEGVRGLQSGLGSALLYQAFMNGARLGLFDPFKDWFERMDSNEQYSVECRVLAGCSAGVVGAAISSPLYLAKTRMQAQRGGAGAGTSHSSYQYKNTLDCFRQVLKVDGVRGLWRGVTASMPRVAMGSGIQLSTYDVCKTKMVSMMNVDPGHVMAHIGASMLAGVAVTVGMNPLDVVSTRMYSQPVKNHVGLLYANPLDCFVKVLRMEGPMSFYKGFLAHYARIGPHTVLTFVFWEQLKKLTGAYTGNSMETENERLFKRQSSDS
eukprot:CFRG3019T1